MSEQTWPDILNFYAEELVRFGADRFDVLTMLMSDPDTYRYQVASQRVSVAMRRFRLQAEATGQPLPSSEKLDQLRTAIDRFVEGMRPITRVIEAMNQSLGRRRMPSVRPALRAKRMRIRGKRAA